MEGKRSEGTELDFSLDSLKLTGKVMLELRAKQDEYLNQRAYFLGFYAGEVLVRNHGFTWTLLEDNVAAMFGVAYAATTSEGERKKAPANRSLLLKSLRSSW